MRNTTAAWLLISLALASLAARGAEEPTIVPVPQDISPEAQAFYRSLRPRPPTNSNYQDSQTMQRLRNGLGNMFLANARRITTDYRLEKIDADGVAAYWVRTGQPAHGDKVILYLHGGGYILGSATTNLGVPLHVGPAASTPVLSVEYRLAPEHPFPAALNDALTTYGWLLSRGYHGRDIALMGDSAGGGLAISFALAARDRKLPMPAAIAALSPVVDLTEVSDTRQSLVGFDPILVSGSTGRIAIYAGNHDLRDPLLSPIYGDLRGLPPLLIQVGTREVLLSDSVRLARRAREAGVPVTLDVWEGMWHVWQEHPTAPEARQASDEIGRFLERQLTAPP
jgi:acetyl esterase/lipase